MKPWPATERELAAPVVEWLSAQHFEVYQEVELHSRVADIVAVDGKRVWVIECKRTMSLDLLDQANRWRWLATWCSVIGESETVLAQSNALCI